MQCRRRAGGRRTRRRTSRDGVEHGARPRSTAAAPKAPSSASSPSRTGEAMTDILTPDRSLQARRDRRGQGARCRSPSSRRASPTPTRRAASCERHRSASALPASSRLIAEIKKASPSKGLIRADFDPPALAKAYAGRRRGLPFRADRRALASRARRNSSTRAARGVSPCRRCARISCSSPTRSTRRAPGAPTASCSSWRASPTTMQARWRTQRFELGMDVLVEVHDAAGARARAEARHRALIGINNRNLRTFETTLATSEKLAAQVPADRLLVGESGIFTHEDCAAPGAPRHRHLPRRREPDAAERRDGGNAAAARRRRGSRAAAG